MAEGRGGWARPEILLPLTFFAAILAGAAVLSLPGMHREGVGPLEALFTSTSCVCVTGLTVVDVGTAFTREGQIAMAALMQLGGLGIMTFSVLGLTLAGRRASLRSEHAIKEGFTATTGWRIGPLLWAVLAVTLLTEALGAVSLYLQHGDAWSALFHSVSGFCNAGFSLHPRNLVGRPEGECFTILLLFVVGGLGFTTVLELAMSAWPRRRVTRRLSLHAFVVVRMTLLLLLGGAVLIALLDPPHWRHALFMSATARTAGFETVPPAQLTDASLLVIMFLMFIGASPGSTGGGIKTTTVAVAVMLVVSILRGRDKVTLREREVPRDLLRRMFAVVTCSICVIMLGVLAIDVLERGKGAPFLHLAFEVISAFGTVGLSCGVTPELETPSKMLLCLVMFIGRVGSVSVFLLLVPEPRTAHVRYPEERVLIG
jgi:trk system potassium uptake protein TrkH